MEDVDLVRRLNKTGRFKLTLARVKTSARRHLFYLLIWIKWGFHPVSRKIKGFRG